MDYAQGQGVGWFIVLFYIIPVLFLYPILLILSLLFKLPKFRKVITIFSLPVLPLYFFYPIMSFSNRLYRFICPYSLEKNDEFISDEYQMIFAIITLGFIFYLIRLYKRQEKEKIKKTLIIYGILFVLFIGIVVLDAVMSKRLYIQNHSAFLPYISALMHTV